MGQSLNENGVFKWQDKNRINNKRCWLYSIPAIVIWAVITALKPGQACFPRMDSDGVDRAGKDLPANEPRLVDLASLLPSARAHNLQIQAGSPAVKLHMLHPKGVEPLGWKSFEKPRGLHVSWWWGSSLLPLGRPTCGWKHPPQSGVAGTGIWPGNRSKGGRRNGTQALSANCQSRNRTFPKALVPPVNGVGHKDMLPPCGHFPKQQLWNCCSWALNIPKACRAVSEKHQPSRNVLGEVIRKIFKTGKMFWIFIQEANLNK